MIVFSRPPGWKRRAGDPGSAGGFAEASVWTSTLRSGSDCPPYNSGRREGAAAAEDGSSSGADALRRPAKSDPSGGLAGSYALVAWSLWCARHHGGPRS